MEQYFNETKGDLKYILEEERRKEANGTGQQDFIPKNNSFSRFFNRLKNLFFKKKLKENISKDDNKLICYILCFITS